MEEFSDGDDWDEAGLAQISALEQQALQRRAASAPALCSGSGAVRSAADGCSPAVVPTPHPHLAPRRASPPVQATGPTEVTEGREVVEVVESEDEVEPCAGGSEAGEGEERWEVEWDDQEWVQGSFDFDSGDTTGDGAPDGHAPLYRYDASLPVSAPCGAAAERGGAPLAPAAAASTTAPTLQSSLRGWLGLPPARPAAGAPPAAPPPKVQQSLWSFFGGGPKGAAATGPAAAAAAAAAGTAAPPPSKKRRLEASAAGEGGSRRGASGATSMWSKTPRAAPFYKWIKGTPFTVDAFRYGAIPGCSAYFLSHFHADHYGGLDKHWVHGPIYCSPSTARLVALKLRVAPQYIRPLVVGCAPAAVRCILNWWGGNAVEGVDVTLLDANHCPGAVVFLFKRLGEPSYVLHTGDFRAPGVIENYPELSRMQLRVLYLDTTYCDPKYSFPPQQAVLRQVAQLARAAGRHTLIVVGAYSIGKERVYMSVAETLDCAICVDAERLRTLRCLDWPELTARLTTDSARTNLHVVPMGRLNAKTLKSMLDGFRPRYQSLLALKPPPSRDRGSDRCARQGRLGLSGERGRGSGRGGARRRRPTGWTFTGDSGGGRGAGADIASLKPQTHGAVRVYGVPYSEHSAYNELRDFVQLTRPQDIVPTVNIGRPEQREAMKRCFREWLAAPPTSAVR